MKHFIFTTFFCFIFRRFNVKQRSAKLRKFGYKVRHFSAKYESLRNPQNISFYFLSISLIFRYLYIFRFFLFTYFNLVFYLL